MENDVFVREMELDNSDLILKFLQKKEGEVNCVVWDAAIVLAKYLDLTCQDNNWLKGKRVLELGAGLGCSGITAACFGSRVILSDLESALPMLKENIEHNRTQWEKQGGSAEAVILEWGKSIDFEFEPELILLADCIYYEESVEPLLNTLDTLLNNKKCYAILSQEERDTPKQIVVWENFLSKLKEQFKVEFIPQSEQHPIYSSSDIHLIKIFK